MRTTLSPVGRSGSSRTGEPATRRYGWADFWCSHHQWETGWDAPASEEWSRKEGDELVAWLRREVASFADVVDER